MNSQRQLVHDLRNALTTSSFAIDFLLSVDFSDAKNVEQAIKALDRSTQEAIGLVKKLRIE